MTLKRLSVSIINVIVLLLILQNATRNGDDKEIVLLHSTTYVAKSGVKRSERSITYEKSVDDSTRSPLSIGIGVRYSFCTTVRHG